MRFFTTTNGSRYVRWKSPHTKGWVFQQRVKRHDDGKLTLEQPTAINFFAERQVVEDIGAAWFSRAKIIVPCSATPRVGLLPVELGYATWNGYEWTIEDNAQTQVELAGTADNARITLHFERGHRPVYHPGHPIDWVGPNEGDGRVPWGLYGVVRSGSIFAPRRRGTR